MFSLFRPRRYVTPGGDVYTLFEDMANQPHLLIAGEIGSGKSVAINGIIYTLLHRGPASAGLILIDPKRVELVQYSRVPYCLRYASEPSDMVDALRYAMEITERRYQDMQRHGLRKYDGGDIYVIIDELADLMTTQKKTVAPILQRLAQIGRAAKVHIIAATQCPIREVIPTAIKCNFDARVALRTRSAQDSRNILGFSGCEALPRYGQCYYMRPEAVERYRVPYYNEAELDGMASYWTSKQCIA